MRSRFVHGLLFGLALAIALIALVIVGGLLWLRSPLSDGFLRQQIVSALDGAVAGEVRLGGVSGDPLRAMRLEDFALVGEDGVALIDAEAIEVSYRTIGPFLDKRIVLDRVRLIRPEIHVVRDAAGRWNFSTLFPREEAPEDAPPGWGSVIDIGTIELVDADIDVRMAEGEWPVLAWNENEFLGVDGEVGLEIDTRFGDLVRVEPRDLVFRTTAPPLDVRRVDGEWALVPEGMAFREIEVEMAGSEFLIDGWIRDSFELEVDAPRIDLAEMRRLFPQVRIEGDAVYSGRVVGPRGDPTVEIDAVSIESGESRIEGSGSVGTIGSGLRLDLDLGVAPLAPAEARRFLEAYPLAQPVSGRVTVVGPPRGLDVTADLRARAGALTVQGGIDLRGRVPAYDVGATSQDLAIGPLLGWDAVDVELTGRYFLEGSGFSSSTLDARFEGELGRSRIYRWDVLALTTEGRLSGDTYRADTLVVRTASSVGRGQGSFGLAGDGEIDVAVELVSEDLADLWPGLVSTGGTTTGSFRLSGPYRGFSVSGDLGASDLALFGVNADSLSGEVRLDDVAGESLKMEAGLALLRFEAMAVEADSAHVSLAYEDGSMDVATMLDHRGEAVTEVSGAVDFDPAARFTLARFEHRGPGETWRMSEDGGLVVTGESVVADSLVIVSNGQSVRADGTFDFGDGADLRFEVVDVDLSDVARVLGQPPGDWEGRVGLRGTLRGTAGEPEIVASGSVSQGRVVGFRFSRIEGEVEYRDRVADVRGTLIGPEGVNRLVLDGRAPIDLALRGGVDRLPERPVDLEIRGVDTNLALLGAVVPGLADMSGPIDLRVAVRGTAKSPRFEGEAILTDGRMTIVPSGVTYRGIEGRVQFDNDRIRIDHLSGRDKEGGRFDVEGEVAVEDLRLADLDLSVRAQNLAVLAQRRQAAIVDADIDVAGTTERPVLTGDVTVVEAVGRLPERTKKDVIDLEEAVIYVDIPGVRKEAIQRSPSIWERSRVDVEIEVSENTIVMNDNARIQIGGELVLLKPAGVASPTLSGALEVKRGFYEEFGERFDIERGEVFFFGTPEIDPGLHVVATQTVRNVPGAGEVDVRVILGGTLKQPTIDLESDPPFEKSEIISIVLFGSPTPSAGQEGQLSQTVSGLVLGAAANRLASQLGQELGLDLVEMREEQEGGEQSRLVRVGKFIGPDVNLTFEQEFGGLEERSLVGLRYDITDRFTLQVTTGRRRDRVAAGLDIFWEITY